MVASRSSPRKLVRWSRSLNSRSKFDLKLRARTWAAGNFSFSTCSCSAWVRKKYTKEEIKRKRKISTGNHEHRRISGSRQRDGGLHLRVPGHPGGSAGHRKRRTRVFTASTAQRSTHQTRNLRGHHERRRDKNHARGEPEQFVFLLFLLIKNTEKEKFFSCMSGFYFTFFFFLNKRDALTSRGRWSVQKKKKKRESEIESSN